MEINEKMIEELKKQGYRISKPKPKEEKEFKPYEAIQFSFGRPSKIIVIGETPKFVIAKYEEKGSEYKLPKSEIYEFNQDIIEIHEELRRKERELHEQESKIREEAWNKINELLKKKFK